MPRTAAARCAGTMPYVFVAGATAAAALTLAPVANADTVAVQQICSEARENLVPMTVVASPELAAAGMRAWRA
ncbi:serine/threonine-protein kinase, putative [Mycolicibacterium rhodesiae JS60]|nr:serine/threonine-protein kinase, putative [Mycolicibacterium rhodesiae JS60]